MVEPGVSETLAASRAQSLSGIRYLLHFTIPENKTEAISAQETIYLNVSDPAQPLLIDFKEQPGNIQQVVVNKKKIPVDFENEHIIIKSRFLRKGENEVSVDFKAGNLALNRRDDFLYTLFVPDRARTAFPCFDQPNLKATFKLSLTIPEHWNAIANGTASTMITKNNQKKIDFAVTEKIPTYLFSFVAGNFQVARESWRGKDIELIYRETDQEKINASLQTIFDRYKKYISFFEDWTGIPYPFQKHGMAAIPDFQFGGMEHPGAILLQSATLFLPRHATEGERNSRDHLLAHEIAHMWFGDLVTMQWFNDVWMKEVFANFMADKATAVTGNEQGFSLKFLTDHLPAAFAADRTPGANPIRQVLDNLENAGTMYGNIIYHKSPIMMRQLEKLIGANDFKKGVQEYLNTFAFKNASWPDLIKVLGKHTSVDLESWNTTWVNRTGRPLIHYSVHYENDQIARLSLTQRPEFGNSRTWQQAADISFYYPGTVRNMEIEIVDSIQFISRAAERKRPLFIQFNAGGTGYGVWPVDTLMLQHLYTIDNYVSRASAYINLFENCLNGRYLTPYRLLELFALGLGRETTELNLKLLTYYIKILYWQFLTPAQRETFSVSLEAAAWKALERQQPANNKKLVFNCLQQIFISEGTWGKLLKIWDRQHPPGGVMLNEDDYTELAISLQLRKDFPDVLQKQAARISNPDRKKRFEIIRPALSFSDSTRDRFFHRLLLIENRSNEAAITAALTYFHHPLRQPSAEKYLQKTLALLPEIQKTGGIFFPMNWLQSTFTFYQSANAYKVVRSFLDQHRHLNENLRNKILQATDNLRRAQSLVN